MKRNLSGIFFRSGSDNIVFEELSTEEKIKIMNSKSELWVQDLCIQLSNIITRLGEEIDIVVNE